MASSNGADAVRPDLVRGAGAALRRFSVVVQRRAFGGRVLGALLRTLLVVATPALLLAWWLPAWRGELLLAVGLVLMPVLAITTVRAWLARRRVLITLGRQLAASPAAAIVNDELLTWLEHDGRRDVGSPPSMLGWLERDVAERLQPAERRQFAQASRPSLGRYAWLLPLVLALLLAWLLTEWLSPPWAGVLGGAGGSSAGANGQQGGGTESADGSPSPGNAEAGPEESSPADDPRPDPAPPEPPPQPEPQPVPPPQPNEPAPLLDLPEQQRFVVPEFVDDGPTRRARMRAAEIEVGSGAAPPTPPPQQQASTGESAAPPQPIERDQQFERAAEQALRSRHVPDAERAIVRRFFDKLQKKGD